MSKAILLLVVTLSKSLGHHLKLCVRGQANPPTHQINTSHLLQGKGVELFVTTTIFYLDQSHNLDTCDVSIDFINEIPPRSACPGNCSPIPRIQLPRQVFSVSLDLAITCSISLRTIKELAHLNSVNPSEMTTFIMILSSIFRIAECTEMPTSPHLLDFVAAHRREVAFLIVYVGSTSRQSFIEKQLIMFRNELFHGPPSKSVVTWVADEGLYVCGSKTTTCRGGQLEGTQIKHVDNYPNSELDPRTSLWAAKPMGEFHGWACAQRRQLRSLAHTLTLFRPNILVMLDDDTFLNWRMLQDNRGYFLLADTSTHPAIFGYRYTWSTSHPVLLGGAGYVLGPHALRALVTSFSGLTHRPQLRAMLEQRGANCSHGSTCGQCVQDNSCRVVDICRDLLSPEHTCYHSDHAMTRCMEDIAGVAIVDTPCSPPSPPEAQGGPMAVTGHVKSSPRAPGGMCQHLVTSKPCNVSLHLTCHRYLPEWVTVNGSSIIVPVPIFDKSTRIRGPQVLLVGLQRSGVLLLHKLFAHHAGVCGSMGKRATHFFDSVAFAKGSVYYEERFGKCKPHEIKFDTIILDADVHKSAKGGDRRSAGGGGGGGGGGDSLMTNTHPAGDGRSDSIAIATILSRMNATFTSDAMSNKKIILLLHDPVLRNFDLFDSMVTACANSSNLPVPKPTTKRWRSGHSPHLGACAKSLSASFIGDISVDKDSNNTTAGANGKHAHSQSPQHAHHVYHDYAQHIRQFLLHFHRDQLLILNYEQMISDRVSGLRHVAEFVNIDNRWNNNITCSNSSKLLQKTVSSVPHCNVLSHLVRVYANMSMETALVVNASHSRFEPHFRPFQTHATPSSCGATRPNAHAHAHAQAQARPAAKPRGVAREAA